MGLKHTKYQEVPADEYIQVQCSTFNVFLQRHICGYRTQVNKYINGKLLVTRCPECGIGFLFPLDNVPYTYEHQA